MIHALFSTSELYEYALQPVHRASLGDHTVFDTTITDTGALSVSSGVRTGRSPKDKRVVLDETTKDVSKNIPNESCRKSGGAM